MPDPTRCEPHERVCYYCGHTDTYDSDLMYLHSCKSCGAYDTRRLVSPEERAQREAESAACKGVDLYKLKTGCVAKLIDALEECVDIFGMNASFNRRQQALRLGAEVLAEINSKPETDDGSRGRPDSGKQAQD